MNALMILWPLVLGSAVTMALIHLSNWLHDRKLWEHLLLAIATSSVAAFGVIELLMMRTTDVQHYLRLHLWGHVASFSYLISVIWFARLYLDHRGVVIPVLLTFARAVVLLLEAVLPYGVNFREIKALTPVEFWGVPMMLPEVVPWPLSRAAEASSLLCGFYVIGLAILAWRKGRHRRACVAAASTGLLVVFAIINGMLIHTGAMRIPYMLSFAFLCVIAPMGLDMSAAVARAAALGRQLRARELEREELRREVEHIARVSTMGQLSASIAHELNQPLAAILTNAQAGRRFLLEPEPRVAEVVSILDDIVSDDKRAGDVIRRLRAMVEKRHTVEVESIPVHELVADAERLMHGLLARPGIALSLDLDPRQLRIHAGRVEMQQALLNLLLNAVEALGGNPEGKRRLSVRTELDGSTVRIRVRDNGPGIPADAFGEIFRPFFSTKPRGLGMGLPICRTICEAHGGTLNAANHPDGGAEFVIAMPSAPPA
jgi:signal transduction histidine kinase